MIRRLSYSTAGMASCRELASLMRAAVPTRSYDTMIGIGISGALVIPAMGRYMRKHWALARKSGVGSHAGNTPFEGRIGGRVLIVDDWISTGATVAVILGKLTEAANENDQPAPEVVGVFEYQSGRYSSMASLAGRYGAISRAWATYTKLPPVPVARTCSCGCED